MNTNYNFLQGTGVALITPFTKTGQIDFDSLNLVINHCIQGGVDYLVSMGSTGEAATLSFDERLEVIYHTVKICNGRIPILAGVGGNNTAELIRESKLLNPDGLSGILSSSPAYNKPSQEGIYRHYMELAEHSNLPIVIYNVPGRTASNISPETCLRLAFASVKFAAIKEASGDLTQATKIIKDKPTHFQVLSGDDPLALGLIGIGGTGVISVIANIYPCLFSNMIRFALNGEFSKAQQLNLKLFDLHKWLYIDGNPSGVKAAAWHLGLCENNLRLPLVPMSQPNFSKLIEEIKLIGSDLI